MRFKFRFSDILKKSIIFFIGIFIYCEFLNYYVVISQCRWPSLDPSKADRNITLKDPENVTPLKAMLLADTHLLGKVKSHWLDKLLREWQMRRAFQAAVTIHQPDVVFVLGDLTDEGLWCSKPEFENFVNRFYSMFKVPENIPLHVVAGNHDMGFHYGISPYLNQRFVNAFEAPTVRLLTIKDNHFIMINSMALEGDGCFLCRPAELQLNKIQKTLQCAQGQKQFCTKTTSHITQYSRPIILQHYPLYRTSDAKHCEKPIEGIAPEPDYSEIKKERIDVLSKGASYALLHDFVPRVAIGGHTHHGCYRKHPIKGNKFAEEYSIPSFNCRNRNEPSFFLAVFTPNNHAISMCNMPTENSMIYLWLLGISAAVIYIIISERPRRKYKEVPCNLISSERRRYDAKRPIDEEA